MSRFPLRTHTDDLRHHFEKYGKVRDVNMKGTFAFVDFADPSEAAKGNLPIIFNIYKREKNLIFRFK